MNTLFIYYFTGAFDTALVECKGGHGFENHKFECRKLEHRIYFERSTVRKVILSKGHKCLKIHRLLRYEIIIPV